MRRAGAPAPRRDAVQESGSPRHAAWGMPLGCTTWLASPWSAAAPAVCGCRRDATAHGTSPCRGRSLCEACAPILPHFAALAIASDTPPLRACRVASCVLSLLRPRAAFAAGRGVVCSDERCRHGRWAGRSRRVPPIDGGVQGVPRRTCATVATVSQLLPHALGTRPLLQRRMRAPPCNAAALAGTASMSAAALLRCDDLGRRGFGVVSEKAPAPLHGLERGSS